MPNTRKILVVDDDPGLRDALTEQLPLHDEFEAIARAQLRQREASEDAIFTIGPYTFRPSSKLLLNPKGNKVRLTERETSILRYPYRARPAAGIAPDAVAGGLGLQFGSDDAHARNAHLLVTAEDGKRRRHPRHPRHRGRRLQAGAVIAMP